MIERHSLERHGRGPYVRECDMPLRQLGNGVLRFVEETFSVNDLTLGHQPIVVLIDGVSHQVDVGLLHLFHIEKCGACHVDRTIHNHLRATRTFECFGSGRTREPRRVVAPLDNAVAEHIDYRGNPGGIKQVGFASFVVQPERHRHIGTLNADIRMVAG